MRKPLLILAAVICLILLFVGTLAALLMGVFCSAVLIGALCETMWDLALFAFLCLITIALPSICCFAGLLFLIDRCIHDAPAKYPMLDRPFTLMAIASVIIAIIMFWSTQSSAFTAVCIAADALYILFIILYLYWKRGKNHDPDRS